MQNGTMMQYFHWYNDADGSLWKQLKKDAKNLAKLGITAVWLPPAYKATSGGYSVGYDVYDIYDLGEFDQKGSVRTKYGTKAEYLSAIKALHTAGVQVYVDIVLNHMGGGDEVEKMMAVRVDEEDRTKTVGELIEIEAYTKFTFPGRKKKYSEFEWNYMCFTGVDHAVNVKEQGIFNLMSEYGNDWDEVLDNEKGNYDYLMYNDIETRNPAVRDELKKWGKWYLDTTGFDGVRLDAVKHISPKFYNEWLDSIRSETETNIFAVGEYWAPGNLELLLKYIETTEGRMSLFDAALHHNFHEASKAGKEYDLTKIFDSSLTQVMPEKSVTVVDNHDTQPLQALEAPVEPWFKPIAYALVLLRQEGYPCLFYPDLYSATYKDNGSDGNEYEIYLPKVDGIEELLKARKDHAYGTQRDYFDHGNCIGWTREGDEEHSGCAVIISNSEEGFKTMEMGPKYAGKKMKDLLGKCDKKVTIDKNGMGEFYVMPGSVSVWVAAK